MTAAAVTPLTSKDVGGSVVLDVRTHNSATVVAYCTQAPPASHNTAERLCGVTVKLE